MMGHAKQTLDSPAGALMSQAELGPSELQQQQHYDNIAADYEAHYSELLDSGLPDNSFDCVVVIGGLHHIHPYVKQAMEEIHRVLKPGGHLCFFEPHSKTHLVSFRSVL